MAAQSPGIRSSTSAALPEPRPAGLWRRFLAIVAAAAGVSVAAAGLAGEPPRPGPAAHAERAASLPLFQTGEAYYEYSGTLELPDLGGLLPFEPVDVAVDNEGTVLIADVSSLSILRFGAEGQALPAWKGSASATQLFPWQVAVDRTRDRTIALWMAAGRVDSRQSQAVVEVHTAGVLTPTWAAIGVEGWPSASIDPDSGDVLIGQPAELLVVFDIETMRVQQYIGVVASRLFAALPGSKVAVVTAADPATGEALLGDYAVRVHNHSGAVVATHWLRGPEPAAIGAGPDGTVLVVLRESAGGAGTEGVLALSAGNLEEVGSYSASALGIALPPAGSWPWAIDSASDSFALTTMAGNFEVHRHRLNGGPIHSWSGSFGRAEWTGAPPPRSASPMLGLGDAGGGTILALVGRSSAAVALEPDGDATLIGVVPHDTVDVALGEAGELYAATSNTLMRLDAAPVLSPTWTAECDCTLGGRLAAGGGVAYVSRPRQKQVAAFDSETGAAVAHVELADAVGLWPADVAVGRDGRLLTADLVTSQVQVWRQPQAPEISWQAGLLAGPRRVTAATLADGTPVFGAIMADGYVELHEAVGNNLLARWRPELPDGTTFPMADIAVGDDGHIYLADPKEYVIRVYAPGDGTAPTPAPNPTATPTPSELSCVVTGDKIAGPPVVVLGNTASVTLTLAADCPVKTQVIGADIMLVIDRSGSMVGEKVDAARRAATTFVELLDVRVHRIGVVSFAETATVNSALSDQVLPAVDAIAAIEANGGTSIFQAIITAADHLALEGRSDALPVIVLLSDGHHGGSGDPLAAAADARNNGIQLYTIGLGTGADGTLLMEIAGRADRYFYAPTPEELFPIYHEILRLVVSSLAGNLIIDDEMSAYVDYLLGSARPPGLEGEARVRWGRSLLPSTGVTLTYDILPRATGVIPTNRRAVADYTDADGVRRQYEFPVPEILVITPTPSPTPTPNLAYLPISYKEQCIPGVARADVVLLIDTSSSMAGSKLAKAKEAAASFLSKIDMQRGDQAAVIGFNSQPLVAAGLGQPLPRLLSAIDGLAISTGTRIDQALLAAGRELTTGTGRNPRNRAVIVLLSDGAHNGPSGDVIAAAEAVAPAVDATYAIGLGADVDEALLRAIASPGAYHFAPDENALERVYGQIAVRLPCR